MAVLELVEREASAVPVRVEEMTLTLEWPSTELISR